jgi:primosomal protein N' (replication factor Y)
MGDAVIELYARKAAEALHTRCQALLETHPAWKKRVLMMLLDQPGVKVLRGKSRWHVMFKLLVNPATEEFVAALTELAREPQEGAEVYFEYNPTTMM